MTDRPKLYPGHRHQWADAEHAVNEQFTPSLVRCTVCGFQAPRNVAGLDGRMTEPPGTDTLVEGGGYGLPFRRTDPQPDPPDQEPA